MKWRLGETRTLPGELGPVYRFGENQPPQLLGDEFYDAMTGPDLNVDNETPQEIKSVLDRARRDLQIEMKELEQRLIVLEEEERNNPIEFEEYRIPVAEIHPKLLAEFGRSSFEATGPWHRIPSNRRELEDVTR